MTFVLWADFIDVVREDKYVQVACASSKIWDEEVNLYFTPSTMLCYLAEDKEIVFEKGQEPKQNPDVDDVILCNLVVAII